MSQSHPMMAEANHDERAEQLFVRDFKVFMQGTIDPIERRIVETVATDIKGRRGDLPDVSDMRDTLMDIDVFRSWVSYKRVSQEMLWDAIGTSVDRQLDDLDTTAAAVEPKGTLTLDPDFAAPRYLDALDIHMMPGGYARDDGGLRQGAVMDRGGAVYMLGRNGGSMNDARGHTVFQHLFDRYPDFEPKRILELGCGVGSSLVPAAEYFPDAEIYGVDVGASMLRYAHARAEALGAGIHFAQQNAEKTTFEDESFDLVFSAVLIHETSQVGVRNIMRECHRLLKPGGLVIHLEVPSRVAEMGVWGRVIGDFEALYNNEPFWRGAQEIDLAALMRDAGFAEPLLGHQTVSNHAERGVHTFGPESLGVFRSWFVASARK